MNRRFKSFLISIIILTLIILDLAQAYATDWSEPITINRRREGMVVTYRAKIDSGYLIVEAKHGEGWHTYSMDNVARAQHKSGKEIPETELPTVIKVGDELKTFGAWFQTTPKDLTMQSIKWYTWGFVNTSKFAIKVNAIEGSSTTLTISAQACNATQCSMVDAQTLTLNLPKNFSTTDATIPPALPDKKYVRVGDPKVIEKL
jgi:hypothetical protein